MAGRRALLVLLAVSVIATDARAQAPPDLSRATLEDLMKMQITSASRKEQPIEEVPAAVFVLTQDDIRRSGMRTIPELLRLVPGVQVGRINSSIWACRFAASTTSSRTSSSCWSTDGRSTRGSSPACSGTRRTWCSTTSSGSRSFADRAPRCGAPTPSTA
jgi:hypothetical protein